jgi:flagellar hook protein FlgE
MNIGVTGMDAYQQDIDVISNNIANVGTAGYKGQSITFQDLLYQTQLPASGPTKSNGGANLQQVGIGVKVGTTDTNLLQGGIQTTGVNTNMMINGNGYFILNNTDGTGTPRYTRAGDFSLNQNGTLYDPSSGLGVMGYTANSAGVINSAGAPQPIQIPIGLASTATATGSGVKLGPANDKNFDMTFAGNLDSSQYATAVSNGAVLPDNLISSGTTIYDSLGGAHLVNITFAPELSSAAMAQPMPFQVSNPSGTMVTAATEWAYTLSSTDGTLFGGGAAPSTNSPVQYAFFDQSGQFINTSGISAPTAAGGTIGTASVHLAGASAAAFGGDTLTIAQWGGATGANNSATPGSATPLPPAPLGLDFSTMTSDASTNAAIDTGQNGTPPGTLSNISVGLDGIISGSFTNGQVLALARVSLATFQNAQGLTRLGGSQYAQSVNSGEPQVGSANSGGFGAIDGDSLEMSNVSIADEFTKLITAQNAFAANSKSITTANENLQTVINLIH